MKNVKRYVRTIAPSGREDFLSPDYEVLLRDGRCMRLGHVPTGSLVRFFAEGPLFEVVAERGAA